MVCRSLPLCARKGDAQNHGYWTETAPGLKLVGRRVGKVEIYHLALEGTDPQLEREDPQEETE